MATDERSIAREVRALRRLPFTEVRQSIIQSMRVGHDVESQRHTLSLRCTLSQSRIVDPARFKGCTHYQCFDATAFLSATHRTRRRPGVNLCCPICERNVNQQDMVIDLYFDDILRRTPATMGEVYLQANGEWRTRDGHFTSLKDAIRITVSYTDGPNASNLAPNSQNTNPEPNPHDNGGLVFFSIIGFIWFVSAIYRLFHYFNWI
ncbi:unnamed protein product [Rhizoctonia solani]|uniref:SP-RING-type domain-containing protein n=1 Tax=Rhizoctonia solani TaxID=456999 RepID=A0A8H3D8H0_9AGAM|nr:unnamed protein product [Rhizoctonia solani]